MLLVGIALFASPSFAVPTAYYSPFSGSISIDNDFVLSPRGTSIVRLVSKTNQFTTNASAYATIPGAFLDPIDLPSEFWYRGFPLGHFYIGKVVTPGTPASDLYSDVIFTSEGPIPGLTVVSTPEPSCLSLLIAAGATMAAAASRRVT